MKNNSVFMDKKIILSIVLIMFFQFVFSQGEKVNLKGVVTDKAAVLSYDEFTALEDRLKKHNTETKSEIKVCIIDKLPNVATEEYAYELFKKNKIGQNKEDKGVLIWASIKDFKIKIEVGTGLKSKLTETKISGIIKRIIGPEFNKKKYYRGINFGITQVITAIENRPVFTNNSTITQHTNKTEKGIPVLKNFVTDNANLLSTEEFESLEKKLKDYETTTTNQIVVVTIESLNGEILEDYAYRLFKNNKIGQEKEDNGLLILVSKNDRKVRLEVGYGFEHLLTDAKSSRIIREIITPNFKSKDYYKGIDLGITEAIATIKGEPTLIEKTDSKKGKKTLKIIFKIITSIVLLFFLIGPIVALYISMSKVYSYLINSFRGLLVGKIIVPDFLTLLIINTIVIGVALAFVIFCSFFVSHVTISLFDIPKIKSFVENLDIHIYPAIVFLVVICVIVPFIIAFFFRKHVKGLPIKIVSSGMSNKSYLRKYTNHSSTNSSRSRGYSSSGSSSYRSSSSSSFSSSSSSSSSSFSGGGGSSGGGGASGDW